MWECAISRYPRDSLWPPTSARILSVPESDLSGALTLLGGSIWKLTSVSSPFLTSLNGIADGCAVQCSGGSGWSVPVTFASPAFKTTRICLGWTSGNISTDISGLIIKRGMIFTGRYRSPSTGSVHLKEIERVTEKDCLPDSSRNSARSAGGSSGIPTILGSSTVNIPGLGG